MINIFFVILSIIFYFKSNTRIYSALIFFFYTFNGFQLLSYEFLYQFLFFSKSYDYAILISIIIFFIDINKNLYIIRNNKLVLYISVFFIFVITDIIFSIIVYNYEFKNVIRASRHFFLLTSLFYFTRFSLTELNKIFQLLVSITIFLAVLYILQYPLQKVLFGGGEENVTVNQYEFGKQKWKRFYNLPYFLYPVLFYYFFVKRNYTILFLLLIVILLPLHRALLFAVILTFFVLNVKSKKAYSNYVIIASIVIVLLQIEVFYSRMISGIVDFTHAFSNQTEGNNTLYFRLMHFYERFQYILNNNKLFYGLGFITEDSFFAQKQIFQYGLINDQGQTIQIDTGDFSWSLFILKLGFVGTFIFVFIYFYFLKAIKGFITNYKFLLQAFLLLSFFISFASTSLYSHRTYVIMSFLYILIIKNEINETKSLSFNNNPII